jgi:hypothetical protein
LSVAGAGRRTNRLVEIEVAPQIPKLKGGFSDAAPWIGAHVFFGIEPLAVHKVVFDEFHVGVETQKLMIDGAFPGDGKTAPYSSQSGSVPSRTK